MPASCSRASPEQALSPSASTAFARKPPTLLLVRLTAMAVIAPLVVRAGLPRLQRWLEPSGPRAGANPSDIEFVGGQYGKWVDSIIARGQPLVRPGCLTRGVTLYYALRSYGVDVA